MIKSKKQMYIVVSAFAVILMLFTTTYAFFNYTRTGTANTIRTGRIAFNSAQGQAINLTNMFPIDVTNGIPNDNTKVGTVTINVTGDTTYTEGLEYLVSAVNVQNTVGSKSLPISIDVAISNNTNNDPATTLGTSDDDYFIDRGGDTSYYKVLAGETINTDDQLVVGYIAPGSTGVDGNILVRAYLDNSKIAISDTYNGNETDNMGTTTEWVDDREVFTTTEWNSLQQNGVSFQVKVESNEGIWVEAITGEKIFKKALKAKTSCTPTWTDESDGTIYLSGDDTCIDMNYVWYSGKLWQITAIYPDGRMKLLSKDNITSILWGSNATYDGSWVYQWLNEDFYDTLTNTNDIIDIDYTWNYSTDPSYSTPLRPESITQQKTKNAPVGLLNLYEYYNSYRNDGSSANSYLNNGYVWWLITPYTQYKVATVERDAGVYSTFTTNDGGFSVRPSIVIKSGLFFVGEGTKTSPYKIVGDNNEIINNTTLLNSRSSGEYVNFDNNLYRIVDTSGGKTKLTMANYLQNSENIITKKLASESYFGKSTNTQSDDYWDYYLNNTWYNSITSTYKNMLVDDTYYLGLYSKNSHYKETICKDDNLNNVTTKNCIKYTTTDVDKTFVGKVGLPRVGEMFSSLFETPSTMWTLTPLDSTYAFHVYYYNSYLAYNSSASRMAARPTITLKSGIKITGGTGYVGGETNSPFEISE